MKTHSTNTMQQKDDSRVNLATPRIPWWIATIVILGTIAIVAGAVISKIAPTMLTNGNPMTDAARVYADYVFARNLALAIMLLFLLIIRARQMLGGFMALIALIQFLDILNDLARGAFVLVPGLLVFTALFLIGAWQLLGQAPWHLKAWRG